MKTNTSSQFVHKMKSIIILVSLIVSAECCGSLFDDEEDRQTSRQTKVDQVEPKPPGQNTRDDSNRKVGEYEPQVLNSRSLDFPTSSNSENGTIKPLVGTEDMEKTPTKLPTSFNEMLKRAAASRDNAIKNAALQYEKMKKDVQALKQQANMERNKTLESVEEQYRKAESLANSIAGETSSEAEKARKKAQEEYTKRVSSFDGELEEAVEQYEASINAAGDKFLDRRDLIEDNKRDIEHHHHNLLEKALRERDAALRLAKQKLETARRNDDRAGTRSQSAANTESEYQKEVKLAQDKWLKVLDDIGIGREYEAALKYAADELDQAREEAARTFADAIEMHDQNLEFATIKKQRAHAKIKNGGLTLHDEYEKVVHTADNYRTDKSKEAWYQWLHMVAKANEEFQRAHIEFAAAKKEAMDKWRNDVRKINEIKRQRIQKAKAEKLTPKTPSQMVGPNIPQNQRQKKPVSNLSVEKK